MRRSSSDRNKRKGPQFVMLRYDLLDCPDFIGLSSSAKELLLYLLRQFNGYNNGDFSLTLTVLRKWGFTSNDTVRRAANELISANLLELTRQGGRRKCSLYGVTFMQRNECGGKLDLPPTAAPVRALSMKRKAGVSTDGANAGSVSTALPQRYLKKSGVPPDGTLHSDTVPADGTPNEK